MSYVCCYSEIFFSIFITVSLHNSKYVGSDVAVCYVLVEIANAFTIWY